MKNFNEIIERDALTLVDFYASWCGPCKMMHPILEELKKNIGDRATILKMDIDDMKNKPWVQRFNIASVPTLILFRKGEQLWRQSGVVSAFKLEKLIEQFQQQPEPQATRQS